jgi:PhnB protein
MAAKKKSAKGGAKKKAVKKVAKAAKAIKAVKKAVKTAAKTAKKAAKKATKKKKASAIPTNYPRVTAGLNLPDARAAIDFCKKVFGGKLGLEMVGPDGKLVHSEVRIGDSVIMIMDAVREPVQTGSLMVYVKDVDAAVAIAVQEGATVLNPATNMFWGDRHARVRDSQGNQWGIATHIEDVTPGEMRKRGKAFAAQMAAASAAASG